MVSNQDYAIVCIMWPTEEGPSIKYVTLFWTNFYPLPLSHFVTHLLTPLKYVTHLGPPFLVVHEYIHMSLQGGFLVREGACSRSFVQGFLSGRFCPSPSCHNTSVTTE